MVKLVSMLLIPETNCVAHYLRTVLLSEYLGVFDFFPF